MIWIYHTGGLLNLQETLCNIGDTMGVIGFLTGSMP